MTEEEDGTPDHDLPTTLEGVREMVIQKGAHQLLPYIDEAQRCRERFEAGCDAVDRYEAAAEAHRREINEIWKKLNRELIHVYVFRDAAIHRLPEDSPERAEAAAHLASVFPQKGLLEFLDLEFPEFYMAALKVADDLRAGATPDGVDELDLHRLTQTAHALKAEHDALRAPICQITDDDLWDLMDESQNAMFFVLMKSLELAGLEIPPLE